MRKNIKSENIFFLAIFCLILFGSLIKVILKPSSINAYENRYAYQLPKSSIKTFLDKSYQEQYEQALTDQIPLSSKMKIAKKSIDILSRLAFFAIDKEEHAFSENII